MISIFRIVQDLINKTEKSRNILRSGKKKDAMAAAALDACRMLDRLGLLKPSHQSAREKKVQYVLRRYYIYYMPFFKETLVCCLEKKFVVVCRYIYICCRNYMFEICAVLRIQNILIRIWILLFHFNTDPDPTILY
jgi:hypothetical protein